MRSNYKRCESPRHFLEPPHRHDPSSVSIEASLPPSVTANLPADVKASLWDFQESTSVAYASYERLEDLLDERFERLMPSLGRDGLTFSESSWFNYNNHLQAEKDYLVSDALPDWQHKASLTSLALQPYYDLPMQLDGCEGSTTLVQWWSALQAAVSKYLDATTRVSLPEFDDTVREYVSSRHEMAICESEGPSPLDTPVREDEVCDLGATPAFRLQQNMACASSTHISHQSTLCDAAAKSVELRKDSGIGMTAF